MLILRTERGGPDRWRWIAIDGEPCPGPTSNRCYLLSDRTKVVIMPRTNKARPNEQINGRPSVTCLRHDVAEAIPIGWWRELEVGWLDEPPEKV